MVTFLFATLILPWSLGFHAQLPLSTFGQLEHIRTLHECKAFYPKFLPQQYKLHSSWDRHPNVWHHPGPQSLSHITLQPTRKYIKKIWVSASTFPYSLKHFCISSLLLLQWSAKGLPIFTPATNYWFWRSILQHSYLKFKSVLFDGFLSRLFLFRSAGWWWWWWNKIKKNQ